ncbi:tellurite resistance TerB family protein [Halopseudomonas bauzanensis]|uniref:tellurite resistance TerB family protein n=1 Tax=Halopseudomonas bauzanensis TaxID=653930 RepID=UPI0025548C2A|nr:tellurite resistance TerB family protein [Halopseudomonas bauzanensis]
MNTRSLLDQLLNAGKDLLQNQNGGQSNQPSHQPAASGNNSPLGGLLGSLGGGALGGGAVSLLLGSKKARKMGGKVITYGGLAALGVVAYKAYSNWQSKQNQPGAPALETPLRTVDRVPALEVEQHSQAILRAVIGAAKADGHIDDRERELIDGEVAKLTNDPQLKQWFDQELRKPLDPYDIAQSARTPEIAAEMYLASIIMVDEESYMERAYLDELARQLKLEPGLKSELETQALAALR